MDSPSDFHTLLVFPPVWTPATPYLALPVLTAYLKQNGCDVSQFDAGIDFFVSHLFTPRVLAYHKGRLLQAYRSGKLDDCTDRDRSLVQRLESGEKGLEELFEAPQDILAVFRKDEAFFDPQSLMLAQRKLYALLRFVSLANPPLHMTFNKYFHGIETFRQMIDHCDDEENNLFLAYYRDALPRRITPRTRLVGISISTAQQLVGALTLARRIRKNHPHIHVTLGGKHLLRLKNGFAAQPGAMEAFCHSLIMDNGEKPLLALIETLKSSGDLSTVPNLVYFRDDGLHETAMVEREPLEDLPTPDFEDLDLKSYLTPSPLVPVRISEGCYWGKCTFCARYYLTGFATIPPETVAEQMEELHRKFGVTDFTVNDDCLTPRYLEALSRKIIQRRLPVFLSLWCKPVHSFTAERLRLMYQAGVRLIRWGVETGHPRILSLMNKGTRIPDTLRVLRDSSDAGIWNHATIILGFPSETEAEAQATIEFLTTNRDIVHSSILYRFVLLDHSYIRNRPEEFGITAVESQGNVFSNVLHYRVEQGMAGEEVDRFVDRARSRMREEVYGNPFWYHARIREYLFQYVCRYGKETVLGMKVDPITLTPTSGGPVPGKPATGS